MKYIFLIIGFQLLFQITSSQVIKDINLLTKEQLTDSLMQSKILKIADSLAKKHKEKEALLYYKKVIPFLKDESKKAQILAHKSACLFHIANYSEIIKNIKTPIGYYEQKNDSANLPEVYNLAGLAYLKMGLIDSASHYLYKALHIVEIRGSEIEKADTYNNLSSIYLKMKEYRKALYFYNKCYKIDSILGDSVYLVSDLNSIGTAYYLLKNFDSAEFSYLNALDICKKINSDYSIGSTYDGLGRIYNKKGESEKAFMYLNKALDFNMDRGYLSQAAINLNNISAIYSNQKNYEKAIKHIKKAIKINKELNHRISLADNLKNLGTYYAKSGNYKSAYKIKDQFEKLNDSILSEDLNKKFADFEIKYKTAQKDREIALQNLEIEKQISINKKQGYIITLILSSVVLLIVILLITVYYKRKNREKNKVLHKFNTIIDSQINRPEKKPQTPKNKTAEIAAKIVEHLNDEKIIRDTQYSQSKLARELETNTTYISNAFSKYITESFNDYLNKKRIILSKKMIRETELSFIDIFGKCGFNSYGAFSKSFNKNTGMSPKEYRKMER